MLVFGRVFLVVLLMLGTICKALVHHLFPNLKHEFDSRFCFLDGWLSRLYGGQEGLQLHMPHEKAHKGQVHAAPVHSR